MEYSESQLSSLSHKIEGITTKKPSLEKDIAQIQEHLAKPEVWSNMAEVTRYNQELKDLENKLTSILTLQESWENMQVAQELQDTEQTEKFQNTCFGLVEEIENSTYLSGKWDKKDALLSVHAGAGGVDAQDWAAMLASMYQAFTKNMGWQATITELSAGDEGGLKSITIEIKGLYAYGYLKEEIGTHRLVRISPFNSGKTRETSFALVEAIPLNINEEKSLVIDGKDLRWDYFMASGKGGQSVNTTYSAVRLVHIPTNTVVTCQNERSQQQNKLQALSQLKDKLIYLDMLKKASEEKELKGEFRSPEWGNQIRNYVLHPYKLVKDARSGFESANPMDIIENGNLLPIIWSVKKSRTV